ncbi:MAG: TonB-dependent receptor, partial [Bacteroidota bacterium]
YKDLPRLLQNPYLETELLAARGRAYGAEISLRKNRGAITGWLSYAYGRTLRRVAGNFPEEIINGGDWFPAPFDQPHQVNLVSNIKINRRNTLSVNFIYSTGRPITVPVGDFIAGSAVVPIYSDRNQFRIPDYHRLDLSYTVKTFAIRKQRYQDSFTFSLYNLYFRRNAFSVFFEPDDRQIPRTFLLAVIGTAIPALTYNFNF